MTNFENLKLKMADSLCEAALKSGPLSPLPEVNLNKKRTIPSMVNPRASLYPHS